MQTIIIKMDDKKKSKIQKEQIKLVLSRRFYKYSFR